MSFATYVALGIVAGVLMVTGAALVGVGVKQGKNGSIQIGAWLMVIAFVVMAPAMASVSAA